MSQGIAVVFRVTLTAGIGSVTTYLTSAQAKAARDQFANSMTAAWHQQHPNETGPYGDCLDHQNGNWFAMMTASPPAFPGNSPYPVPPRGVLYLESGPAPIEYIEGEEWDPPPP